MSQPVKNLLRRSVNAIPPALRGWIRRIPIVAASQRWLVQEVLSGEPFVHTINGGPAAGLRFEITLPMDKPIWAGTYEPAFTRIICSAVRPGAVCYDVGAYRGYVSGAMALAGASRVVMFEPLPANVRALETLQRLNPALPLELKPVAVGASDAPVQLKVMPDASMGKLSSSPFQALAEERAVIEVDLRRLDSLVERGELPPPDVMKIDVEGAELDVLRGAQGILGSARPVLFVEAHSRSLEEMCSALLGGMGYAVVRLEQEAAGDEDTRHLVARPLS